MRPSLTGSSETAAARAVLWDLDGTLADTRMQHWQAWRDALDEVGVTITESQFLATFGRRNDAILTAWLGSEATPERIRRLGDAKEERFRKLIGRDGLGALPGATAWVRRLTRHGWRQAIASSAPRRNVEVMRRALGLEPYIPVIVAAEDVTAGKPDPEVFVVAAERLGVPAAQCVVIEDAHPGIEAARRAGMRSIGVGPHQLPTADRYVTSLTELPPDAFESLVPP